jgi:hypothetical protein
MNSRRAAPSSARLSPSSAASTPPPPALGGADPCGSQSKPCGLVDVAASAVAGARAEPRPAAAASVAASSAASWLVHHSWPGLVTASASGRRPAAGVGGWRTAARCASISFTSERNGVAARAGGSERARAGGGPGSPAGADARHASGLPGAGVSHAGSRPAPAGAGVSAASAGPPAGPASAWLGGASAPAGAGGCRGGGRLKPPASLSSDSSRLRKCAGVAAGAPCPRRPGPVAWPSAWPQCGAASSASAAPSARPVGPSVAASARPEPAAADSAAPAAAAGRAAPLPSPAAGPAVLLLDGGAPGSAACLEPSVAGSTGSSPRTAVAPCGERGGRAFAGSASATLTCVAAWALSMPNHFQCLSSPSWLKQAITPKKKKKKNKCAPVLPGRAALLPRRQRSERARCCAAAPALLAQRSWRAALDWWQACSTDAERPAVLAHRAAEATAVRDRPQCAQGQPAPTQLPQVSDEPCKQLGCVAVYLIKCVL